MKLDYKGNGDIDIVFNDGSIAKRITDKAAEELEIILKQAAKYKRSVQIYGPGYGRR